MSASGLTDTESVLSVGSPAVFLPDPLRASGGPRFATVFRGWRKPNYILIDKPTIYGRNAVIREGQNCVIQYVREGEVCSFPSSVLDWTTRAHNAHCRVAWPDGIRMEAFRKYERVVVDSLCRLYVKDVVLEGVAVDVSVGGCQCAIAEPLPLGTEGDVSFALPDGSVVERAHFIVRNVRQRTGPTCSIGIEFEAGQFLIQNTVAFCVMSVLNRTRPCTAAPHRVLVIDDSVEMGEAVSLQLEGKGYDVFFASGLIDGFHRLHGGSVQILLVSQELYPMNGLAVCRAVQANEAFKPLAVYVYGAARNCNTEAMMEAGARTHFPRSFSPAQIAAAVYADDPRTPEPVLKMIEPVGDAVIEQEVLSELEAVSRREADSPVTDAPAGTGMRSHRDRERRRRG